jgi:hypothetical protein
MRHRRIIEEVREPLGVRLARFGALCGLIAAVLTGVVAAQRFHTETLALMVGLLLAGVPLLAVVGLLVVVLLRGGARARQDTPPQMTIPPIIMQLPQQQNPWNWNGNDDAPLLAGRRTWDVIGPED